MPKAVRNNKPQEKPPALAPFIIRDCALSAISTGRRAMNVRELRNELQTAHPGCIYYHFWGSLLRPGLESPEYLNDFAEWAKHGLNDRRLAERLAVIDPSEFSDIEDLRSEVINVIEERLDETEMVPWAKRDQMFTFIRSKIIVLTTDKVIASPTELSQAVRKMTLGSIFYHVIDARRRTKGSVDDFRAWLSSQPERYKEAIAALADIDPFFSTLVELRETYANLFETFFNKGAK